MCSEEVSAAGILPAGVDGISAFMAEWRHTLRRFEKAGVDPVILERHHGTRRQTWTPTMSRFAYKNRRLFLTRIVAQAYSAGSRSPAHWPHDVRTQPTCR